MAFNSIGKSFFPVLFILFFAACSSTIGVKQDLNKVKFEIGVTQKNDVADTLGLPNAINNDQQKGLEYWAYNEKPELTGLILPVVIGDSVGNLSADTVYVPSFDQDKVKSATLICVFDTNSVLVDLQKLK